VLETKWQGLLEFETGGYFTPYSMILFFLRWHIFCNIFEAMKTNILHILLIFVLAFVLCKGASAQEGDLSMHEVALLDLINEARENPLSMASFMGMNPEKILQDLPELKDILTQGLSSLTFNKSLYQAASSHTADMISKGYYSHASLDGKTYSDRIASTGYLALETGESLGLLGFSNFIDPSESVRAVFEEMFRSELDPSNSGQRNILNPQLAQIGISLGTGTLNVGADIFNVYMVTCDFASSVEKEAMELFQLVNQARTRPLEVIASLGMDPDQVLADIPELQEILTDGLSPLTFNIQLYKAAAGHVKDMIENGYYSHDSLDGLSYDDRIRDAGYDPLYAGECLGLQCLGDGFGEDNEEAMEKIIALMFRKIFIPELNPDAEERNILNPLVRETGISLIKGKSDLLGGICGDNLLLMAADFGLSFEEQPPCIVGLVYQDMDEDMLYSPGEGFNQAGVSIELVSGDDMSRVVSLYSSQVGSFIFPAVAGEYRVTVDADGYEIVRDIEIGEEENIDLVLSIPLFNEESDQSEVSEP